jgi:hypothetical protein
VEEICLMNNDVLSSYGYIICERRYDIFQVIEENMYYVTVNFIGNGKESELDKMQLPELFDSLEAVKKAIIKDKLIRY